MPPPTKTPLRNVHWKPWFSDVGPFFTLGLQLALAVILFFFLGRWLDTRLGTAPWLMLAGVSVGIVGGLIHFVREVTALGRRKDAETRKEKDA